MKNSWTRNVPCFCSFPPADMLPILLVLGQVSVLTFMHMSENLNFTTCLFLSDYSKGWVRTLCHRLSISSANTENRAGQLSKNMSHGFSAATKTAINICIQGQCEAMSQTGNETLILICMCLDVIGDLLKRHSHQALRLRVRWTDCGGHSRPPKYMLHCVWSSHATVHGHVFLVYTAPWWRDGKWINLSQGCCWFGSTVTALQ